MSSHARVETDDDFEGLDQLMATFYGVICFEEGGTPDLERLATLFSPHARITRVTPEGVDHLDVSSFSAMVRELVELGAFTSFHEHEVGRSAHRYGRVLHVASAYETKASPEALDYLERGVNSLQLLREQDGWRIVSLCWDSGSFEPDGNSFFT